MIQVRSFQALLISTLMVFLFACSLDSQNDLQGDITSAKQAFFSLNHSRAHYLFDKVWKNQTTTPLDRAEAGRYLVKMDWRIYGNRRKANATLDQLDEGHEEVSLAQSLRARMFLKENKVKEAITWSRMALESSDSEIQRFEASLIYGKSTLVLAENDLNTHEEVLSTTRTELSEAHQKLGEWLRERPDSYDLARLYLGHSILLKNGVEAVKSWRLFFRLETDDTPHHSLLKEPQKFISALEQLGKEDIEDELITRVINGLAESGFISYAILLAELELGKGPHVDKSINELSLYHQYLERLEAQVESYYQKVATQKAKSQDLRDAFTKESKWLWGRLSWDGAIPDYTQSQFLKIIRERFKCLILFNTVSGRYGIHVGQIMLDDRRMVKQHGQSAQFKYRLLENMTSNGYGTWFTDGESAVGGWATSQGIFVQVRSDLNREISKTWSMLKDPVESKNTKKRIAQMSKNEDKMARAQPLGYLPGLQYRLIMRECSEVIDSLESRGLEGTDLRYAFIRYMERIAQDAKIYAHEGRHSIDMKYNNTSGSTNLEYAAKLSEIYFAEKPVFFLGTLLSANMGNGTAHGDANLRLAKNLVGWMVAHKADITGFDDSRPTLPQIELLTDHQLRVAIRSFDPLANES